jgi:ribonucleoside-diphosphate reductase alpha chain
MNDFQTYIHKSRYARWKPELGRRETWTETVARYCDFWQAKYPDTFPYKEVFDAIHNLEVMPSMRALMTAGPALDRDNIAGYNCSYLPIDDVRAFDEAMFILMNGTGLGFSVERQYVQKLPTVASEFSKTDTIITVADSKQGWATALRELIGLLYTGLIPTADFSKVREAGARLKVFGGRASGPKPLQDLFQFTVELFQKAAGRKLNSVECHDLVCKIAQIVVVGGVRRSALISLSNLTDERMRNAKNGAWWEDEKQRALANNSVAYTELPDIGIFMKEWQTLYESKSGERGIFNRVSAIKQAEATGRRDTAYEFGTNPCGEIILRPNGFCNLTEVVVRSTDTLDDLKRKVRLATILGTYQSTLTDFKYIRKVWQRNAEEERLLGVSLTGILDNKVLANDPEQYLKEMKHEAIETNLNWSTKLGIPQSAAITTVKPSGTVSQLVDSASGIHPRHSDYYIRTVRADVKDPLATFLKAKGVPCEADVMNDSNLVFSFPQKAPEGSITRKQWSAVEQLEHYLAFKKHWCEHNPSITVYVRENEWMEVGAWVYKNFDDIGGVSFLPFNDHVYQQAPYQDCTAPEYYKAEQEFPELSWEEFDSYEVDDATVNMHELACVSGACELV